MIEPATIKRFDPESDPASYASLRRKGIDLVQALSGTHWTDFNVHDPGVTILEQLCFRLAELAYRSGFPVADNLAQPGGSISLHQQGLAEAHDILPARPTTVDDLRLHLVSEVAELDNAWIRLADDSRLSVRVGIKPEHIDDAERVVDSVRKICNRQRNLCEDYRHRIDVVPRAKCTLHATLEIDSDSDVARILGEIYFHVSRYVSGELQYRSFVDALDDGAPIDEVYRGPLLDNGMVTSESAADAETPIQVSKITSLVRHIEGVVRIDDLFLRKQGEDYRQSLDRFEARSYACLSLPTRSAADIDIRLISNGRTHSVATSDVVDRLEALRFADSSGRRSHKQFETTSVSEHAEFRDFGQYDSILELLPAVYGVGRYGAVGEQTDSQKARIAQLKAYLSIFDQLMADHCANLEGLRELFSVDASLAGTYFSNPIGNDTIDGIAAMYREPQGQYLGELTNANDDFADRRNRVLDGMLGLYGESYPQAALRSCAAYGSGDRLELELVQRKLMFLWNVVKLTRDRGAAFDYSRKSWNSYNISGLQARVSLFLNFSHLDERSLARPLLDEKLRIAGHEDYLGLPQGRATVQDLDIDASFHAIPESAEPEDDEMATWQERARELRVFKGRIVSDALFRRGTQMANYRLGTFSNSPGYQLVFQARDGGGWWLLASVATSEEGAKLAYAIQALLVDINQRCEGMHIVEHVLLGPLQAENCQSDDRIGTDSSFAKNRLSVVLPNWTRRTADPSFQSLAEQLVYENSPAHVSANVFWLDFTEMYRFEGLYMAWLKERRLRPEGSDELDDIAEELAVFLVSRESSMIRRDGERAYA